MKYYQYNSNLPSICSHGKFRLNLKFQFGNFTIPQLWFEPCIPWVIFMLVIWIFMSVGKFYDIIFIQSLSSHYFLNRISLFFVFFMSVVSNIGVYITHTRLSLPKNHNISSLNLLNWPQQKEYCQDLTFWMKMLSLSKSCAIWYLVVCTISGHKLMDVLMKHILKLSNCTTVTSFWFS